MHDAPPPVRAEPAVDGDGLAGPLTPERIDTVLADFRRWLEELGEDRGDEPPGSSGPEPVDLHTLVAQFVALRHEVNLQTKASRAAVEQTAETIKLLGQPKADPREAVRPLVKALIDVADALAVALRQVEKARAAADELLAVPPAPKPGLLARLFGASKVASAERSAQAEAMERLRPLLAGVADGYALSLRRVERVLPMFGLELIPYDGLPFDPELMEVVEVVDAPGRQSGTVVEEVRRGYRWDGQPYRPVQVKVAR
jgi:molecular chaperone GrpE